MKHGFQIVQRLGAVQHGERIVVVQPSVEDIVDEIVEEGAVDFQLFDFQLAERGGELQIRRTFFCELAQRVHDAFAEFGDVFLLEAGRADGEDDLRRFCLEAGIGSEIIRKPGFENCLFQWRAFRVEQDGIKEVRQKFRLD